MIILLCFIVHLIIIGFLIRAVVWWRRARKITMGTLMLIVPIFWHKWVAYAIYREMERKVWGDQLKSNNTY